ncbi:MAG: aldo/keto reductase [Pseudomonadota bacterium]|nr:aldo/keto reductase [Pseudomonadota bacterium]
MKKRQVSDTGIYVTPLCFGTSPLGSMPDTYGYKVSEKLAVITLKEILSSPVNFIDTSRNYGMGRSEERLGIAISESEDDVEDLVISTKLDRNMRTNRFDVSQARKSFEETLKALRVDRVPILHLHDPEYASDLNDITRKDGTLDFLFSLKREKLVDAVGLAMGRLEIMEPLVADYSFDVIINHNRYSILNRQADRLYDYAYSKGISIFNAAPYAGGILAKGSCKTTKLVYQDATPQQLTPVYKIEQICKDYGIPVGAAALQFSMRDQRISSTIVGISKPKRVKETLDWANLNIPSAFWEEITDFEFSLADPEENRLYKPC